MPQLSLTPILRTILFNSLILTFTFSSAQTLHTVLPSQANPLVMQDTSYSNYVYINDSVPDINKLFLFMPGTGGEPLGYKDILQTAANLGYHAIGLTYVNDTTIATHCLGQPSDCEGLVRAEVYYGQDFSPEITVDSLDGIRARLIDLLNYLNLTYPSENWGQFFAAPDSINWPKVCVSGHSQGAGMASIIAYWYPVNRAVFFATGGDISSATNRPAGWMDSLSVTPPSKKYAFTHRQDELFWGNLNYAPEIWDTLRLFNYGTYISIDTLTNNFYGSHTFTSNVVVSSASLTKYHDCVVVDYLTPLTGNVPAYQPVWQYMLTDTGAALNTGITATANTLQSKIYPNPSSGIFHMVLPGNETSIMVTVSDALGRVISQFRPAAASFDMDISSAPAGLYFVQLTGNDLMDVQRVVKQ